jgi:imidazole glycerol-phosphate synthase subunit HisF
MRRTRVIPSLLLQNRGFYKTTQFRKPVYLGDPINTLKIFNDKEVDEICVLDINATASNKGPQLEYIGEFASECFVPLAYGGGITTMDQVSKIFSIGFEKCIVNTSLYTQPNLVSDAANEFGSQSIVVSIDVRKNIFNKYSVFTHSGQSKTGKNPVEQAKYAEKMGAGEILLTSINNDGMMNGYDQKLISDVCNAISIPVIVNGGANSMDDFIEAQSNGASAVAAGAFFVFKGPHRAVLINVPEPSTINKLLP